MMHPDSWQAHAGQETIANYVAANQVAPLDDLFKSTGFSAVLPATLLPLISKDGHPYSVPVNIHRSNVLWYNPKVLTAAGVTANPKTDFKTWMISLLPAIRSKPPARSACPWVHPGQQSTCLRTS